MLHGNWISTNRMKALLTIGFSILLATAAFGQNKKYNVAPDVVANVKHEQGSKIFQVLMAGVEVLELELTQPADAVYQIKTADYNFDGFKDFAFTSVAPVSGIHIFEIFLYHDDANTFEALEVPNGICETFGNVRVMPGTREMKSSCRTGSVKTSSDTYRWTGRYDLELVGSKDNTGETLKEIADEKDEKKLEKKEQLQEKREDLKQRKQEKKEEREDDDD
jgi:hypothetical protein